MSNKCLVVGYGRLGQTLSEIMRKQCAVAILEKDPTKQKLAKSNGFELAALEEIGQFQTIIVCVPINQFEPVIKEISGKLAPGSLLIDTCSVKVYPVKIMMDTVPKAVQIMATHPLFGPDSVKLGLKGLGMAVCPVRVEQDNLNDWHHFWRGLGVRVLEITPEEHDRAAAYTLGLTHFVGRVLGELNLKREEIATTGFNALLEVIEQTSNDTWRLFHDMQHYNPYTKEMRDKLATALADVQKKLDAAIDTE